MLNANLQGYQRPRYQLTGRWEESGQVVQGNKADEVNYVMCNNAVLLVRWVTQSPAVFAVCCCVSFLCQDHHVLPASLGRTHTALLWPDVFS